jgi:hypothetical protein
MTRSSRSRARSRISAASAAALHRQAVDAALGRPGPVGAIINARSDLRTCSTSRRSSSALETLTGPADAALGNMASRAAAGPGHRTDGASSRASPMPPARSQAADRPQLPRDRILDEANVSVQGTSISSRAGSVGRSPSSREPGGRRVHRRFEGSAKVWVAPGEAAGGHDPRRSSLQLRERGRRAAGSRRGHRPLRAARRHRQRDRGGDEARHPRPRGRAGRALHARRRGARVCSGAKVQRIRTPPTQRATRRWPLARSSRTPRTWTSPPRWLISSTSSSAIRPRSPRPRNLRSIPTLFELQW